MKFTDVEIVISVLQLVAVPILMAIWQSIRKIHRGNVLNGFKITALVHAMQMETQNGFTKAYEKKLSDLVCDAKFVEDK